MSKLEILEELRKMTPSERLKIAESILQSIRSDLQKQDTASSPASIHSKQQLSAAAKSLLADYSAGGELTAFTVLDGEDFHA